MTTKQMTKTAAREVTAELRRETAALKKTLEPPSVKWVMEQIGTTDLTDTQRRALVGEHIKNIEDLLDRLREYADA